MPVLASSFMLQPTGIVSVFACLTLCLPAFAENQSKAAIEIEGCIKKADFYPERFIRAKDTFVTKRVNAFVGCLQTTSNPKDPEIQYWLGFGYKYEVTPTGAWMENSRAAFCAAAAQGYVLAQEECASLSHEDQKAKYQWTLVAALNGSRSAQSDVSIGAWGNAAKREEIDYNNYLVQYLGCHPAMLQLQCSGITEPELNTVCHKAMQELAIKRLADVAQCQKELNNDFLANTARSTLQEWELRASKQLIDTLENIRQQVKRYPGLANLQAIEP